MWKALNLLREWNRSWNDDLQAVEVFLKKKQQRTFVSWVNELKNKASLKNRQSESEF